MTSLKNVKSANEIEWTGFRRIGRGASGTVLVHKMYAIKVGYVANSEFQVQKRGYRKGVCPPAYALFKDVDFDSLPGYIQVQIYSNHIRHYGSRRYVDVLVQGRAKPFTDNEAMQKPGGRDAAYRAARATMEAIEERLRGTDMWFSDEHPGNVGIYRGRPVILDGLAD